MVGIDDGLLEDATSDSNFLTPPTSPTPMWMAPIAVSSPGQHTKDETHDHEFLFHSRAPSVILLESQTWSPRTFPTPSPSKRQYSEVKHDDDERSNTFINPFPDPAPRS